MLAAAVTGFRLEMRRNKQRILWATVLAALVLQAFGAQAVAAPKKTKKKPEDKPSITSPAMAPYVSSFMSYDVGTLQMTGKTGADLTYSVGTLRLTGRSLSATVYNVGTLSMTGKQEPGKAN
jgi:hypothetical protein